MTEDEWDDVCCADFNGCPGSPQGCCSSCIADNWDGYPDIGPLCCHHRLWMESIMSPGAPETKEDPRE